MAIATINPATGETLKIFTPLTDIEIESKLALAASTYQEYRQAVTKELSTNNYQAAIFSAAVADYQAKEVFDGKISSGGALQNIELIPTVKVIKEVRDKFPHLRMITFKYQENVTHEELIAIAKARLNQGYQMVVANRGEEKGNKGEQVAYLVTSDRSPQKAIGKENIAKAIAEWLEESVND